MSTSARSHSAPGSMTLAMSAVRAQLGPKVLRLGVYQGSQLAQELVLRERGSVYAGSSERNTLVLAGEGVPSTTELFALREGKYQLRFAPGTKGRLVHNGVVRTLEQLVESGDARAEGKVYVLALTEESRGKVQLGAASVLFQFVTAPPLAPKSQLPRVLTRHTFGMADRVFNGALAGLIALASGTLGWVEYGFDPEVGEADSFLEMRLVSSNVQLELPQPATPPPAEAAEDPAPTPDNAPPTPERRADREPQSHAPRSPSHPEAAAPNVDRTLADAERAARRASEIAAQTVLNNRSFAVLNASLEGHGPSATQMVAQGGMFDTEESLRGVNITNGPTTPGVHRNLTAANATGGTDLGNTRVVRQREEVPGLSGNPVQEVLRSHVVLTGGTPEPEGVGVLDANAVARQLRGQMGGIQACYNRALRQTPSLAGRLELSFTIGGTGRVTESRASGMDAAPDMGGCVSRVVRGLVFPQPQGGSVSFTFPFNFDHGN